MNGAGYYDLFDPPLEAEKSAPVSGKPLQIEKPPGMVEPFGCSRKETGEGLEDDRAAQVQEQFAVAVAFARELRAVFGPDVRLVYARNERGEELGRHPPGCE